MPGEEEEGNAAVGLEDSLKDFDTLTAPAEVDFASVIKEVEAVSEDPPKEAPPKEEEPPKEDPPEEDPPKEEAAKEDEKDEFFNEFYDGDDVPAEEVEEPPKRLSKAGREDWDKMRAAKTELRTQVKERDTEIEDLRKQVAEIPELRKQAESFTEADRELAFTRVEATQEYKEKIDRPWNEIRSVAAQIAEGAEVNAGELISALQEEDAGQRRQLLKGLTEYMEPIDRDDVFKMARDTQTLMAEQDRIRTEAKEAFKETSALAEKRTAEEARQAREAYGAEVADVVPALQERIPFEELEKGETESGVYQRIQEKVEAEDFSSFSERQKVFAVASGHLMPRVVKQLVSAQKKIETLEARVKELNGKEPAIGDSKVEVSDDDFGGDVVAAVAAAVGGKVQQPITEILQPFVE